ncbi:MAG: sugar phosphate isomerase/epimerase [Lachnospiraceae bacterium]|jgi:L-ribulose-5-phosphate 3-epimerase|nr:sugar phosphate isomerase/epimerase [Lachnospiraceae bacterium]
MKRIIGVNSNCYHGYPIEEALEGIHKAGFRYVELTATKGWTEHVFPTQSFSYLTGLKKKMQELSLIPFALSGHCNLMDRERRKDFVENIELARFFGCDYIVSSVGEAHLEDKETAGNEILAENIKSVIPLLEDADMMLVLEIHGEHSTGKILKEIVDLIGSSQVRINYDTANAIFYGGVKPEEDMQNCIHEIAYMHLKDKRGEQREWDFPALGKGTVDFTKIFENLENNKNGCPFSIEIEFTKEGPKDIGEINRAVADSYQYLKEKGFEI